MMLSEGHAGPYRSEQPVLPCKDMLRSVSELLPKAMTRFIALSQQRPVLMFMSPVTIKVHVDLWGLGLHLSWGHDEVMLKAGSTSCLMRMVPVARMDQLRHTSSTFSRPTLSSTPSAIVPEEANPAKSYHRISKIQGNNRISDRSFSEHPVLMAFLKPEALNLTNNSLYNEHLLIKLFGQRSLFPIMLRQMKK